MNKVIRTISVLVGISINLTFSLASQANATEWLKIAKSSSINIYIAPSTVVKSGNIIRYSALAETIRPIEGDLAQNITEEVVNCNNYSIDLLAIYSSDVHGNLIDYTNLSPGKYYFFRHTINPYEVAIIKHMCSHY